MKINLILLGKTTEKSIADLSLFYQNKLKHYVNFELTVIENSSIRFENPDLVKEAEAKLMLKKILPSDWVVLLDENGKTYSSVPFANQLQTWMNMGRKQICFVVGGAFGFHTSVYERADAKLSLSSMTFSHQLVRPVFLEQLYRAFTILKNEPYHHQ
ncbi:MAG: 23S rRNA (pseudouridine(1915)-N(3))-methyltransferase RlmH [Chitinophagales bacterium]|nr:23S rRNA (pseudouridine(1915)-N(3))-methyltransferase RlmH [Chitinophagales bacterium]